MTLYLRKYYPVSLSGIRVAVSLTTH